MTCSRASTASRAEVAGVSAFRSGDGDVDLDRVVPAGVRGQVNQGRVLPRGLEALDGSGPSGDCAAVGERQLGDGCKGADYQALRSHRALRPLRRRQTRGLSAPSQPSTSATTPRAANPRFQPCPDPSWWCRSVTEATGASSAESTNSSGSGPSFEGTSQAGALACATTRGGRTRRSAPAGKILEPRDSFSEETLPPLAHDLPRHAERPSDLRVLAAFGGEENEPGAHDVPIR
jgi:hypothetical protein